MITLKIHRVHSGAFGTFGTISIAGASPFAVTLEREWLDNIEGVSCIPEGVYNCVRRMYHRGGYETFEVTGVNGRNNILFHKGNIQKDSEGCTLLGEQFEYLDGVPAVLASGKAFTEFMSILDGINEFTLIIENHF